MPPGAIYVGRPTVFGNPWSVQAALASDLFEPSAVPEVCVTCFRRWLQRTDYPDALEKFPIYKTLEPKRLEILSRLSELRGHDLACWCPLESPWCHADVLLEIANKEASQQ